MSSAILYFAIIAIWAVVLVPRWLRRGHEPADHRRAHEDMHLHLDVDLDVELGEGDGVPARRAGSARPRAAGPGGAGSGAAGRREAAASAAAAGRRARVLRARRRMLGTLVALTACAIGIVVAHLAQWWVAVPPGAMLAGFLLILREAARTDMMRARREEDGPAEQAGAGQERHQQRPAPERRHAPAPPPAAAPDTAAASEPDAAPERTAEIIDISARIGDQLYDQYADAAVRAVGD